MKVYDTEIEQYKKLIKATKNDELMGLYDLLDELLIYGEMYVKDTGKVKA